MATTTVTPYSTALPFVAEIPSWLNEYDAQRIAAYNLYEDMYRNHPESMTLMLRGTDDKPIFLPSAKRLINTISRYVLRGWGFNVVGTDDPVTGEALPFTDEEVTAAIAAYGRLFKRERFLSVLKSAKKDGLSKGDWCIYVWADPEKPAGSRISIKAIDPRLFFPIYAEHDPDRITGQDIVEQYTVGDSQFLKRQRFLKNTNPLHPSFGNYEAPIAREVSYIQIQDWEDPAKMKVYTGDLGDAAPALPMEELPGIFNLPVYHIRNNETSGNPFGTSDLSGIENIIAGINQGITDQDMALAMAGLGFYWTDGGGPVDEDGNEVNWIIGPGRVAEVGDGKKFGRVTGVASVEPSKAHIEMLEQRAQQTMGINDVALGAVDASVAESGIALALRMAPLIDATDEKDEVAIEVLNQFLYDLRAWFEVYEGISMPNVTAVSVLGEKLPKNRKERMTELKDMFLDGVISLAYYHEILQDEFGFQFPAGMINELIDGAQRTDEEIANTEFDDEEDADI